jgi:hypothetical protein
MFDGPLPRWPTFAINLVYPGRSDGQESEVFLPEHNNQGWQPRYRKIAGGLGLKSVASFLMAIVETMRNWRDLMQARAPGYRDRIVHVPLTPNEGGLNLDMPQRVLDGIASKGSKAGELLRTRFKFENHWWIRWRTLASATERYTVAFSHAAAPPPDPACASPYATATTGQPKAPSFPFTKAQQSEAQERFAKMLTDGAAWGVPGAVSLTKKAPKPLPQLRIVPTF